MRCWLIFKNLNVHFSSVKKGDTFMNELAKLIKKHTDTKGWDFQADYEY